MAPYLFVPTDEQCCNVVIAHCLGRCCRLGSQFSYSEAMAAPWPGLITATLGSGLGLLVAALLAFAKPVRDFARGRLPQSGQGEGCNLAARVPCPDLETLQLRSPEVTVRTYKLLMQRGRTSLYKAKPLAACH